MPRLQPGDVSEDAGGEGTSKVDDGLDQILKSDGSPASFHLSSLVMLSSSTDDLKYSQDESIRRPLSYILDFTAQDHSFPLVRNGVISYEMVTKYLQYRLNNVKPSSSSSPALSDMDLTAAGKVGPPVVQPDKKSASGDIKYDSSNLQLTSQSNFSSVRANSCVIKGRWMYEATLGTSGIQQLGWATLDCPFTNEEGVGDAPDSYAIDGKRVKKWNGGSQAYGQPWISGDVIGCCIDLDAGEISFSRNGVSLGVAFHGVRRLQPGLGYFPALSLSQGERCELNFGSRPFEFPLEGFLPLQGQPLVEQQEDVQDSFIDLEDMDPDRVPSAVPAAAQADFLLGCILRMARLNVCTAEDLSLPRLRKEDRLLLSSAICQLLGPLLLAGGTQKAPRLPSRKEETKIQAGFVVWASLAPFLLDVYRRRPGHDPCLLGSVLDFLVIGLEQYELWGVIPALMDCLAYHCRVSGIRTQDPFGGPYPWLSLACQLAHRQEVLVLWWDSRKFGSSMEGFLTRKGLNSHDLDAAFPDVWWEGCREEGPGFSSQRHALAVEAAAEAISKLERIQTRLCRKLLSFVPSRVVKTSVGNITPTRQQGGVFGIFLMGLLQKNRAATRKLQPPGLSDNSVLVSAFFVLLRILSEGAEEGPDPSGGGYFSRGQRRAFPVSLFLKTDSLLTNQTRLGGALGHILKTTPLLRPEHYSDVTWGDGEGGDLGSLPPGPGSGSGMAGVQGSVVDEMDLLTEEVDSRLSVLNARRMGGDREEASGNPAELKHEELVDFLVLLYHLGVAANFKQLAVHSQNQQQSVALLESTEQRLQSSEDTSADRRLSLREAMASYRRDIVYNARLSSWMNASLAASWKLEGMQSYCVWIVQLLQATSARGALFSYVPEFYLETLLDSFQALRRSQTAQLSWRPLVSLLVSFLVNHFNDPRVVNPDMRDVLLQAMSALLQSRDGVAVFEQSQVARAKLPAALLATFDKRFWIPVSHILLRLCRGSAFGGTRIQNSSLPASCDTSSTIFQELLAEKCEEDADLLTSFTNRLFNTLNWTVAQFYMTVEELGEAADRPQISELQLRKCDIMFELMCNLLRIVEFLAGHVPKVFLVGPTSEMNIARLSELLVFLLTRSTTGPTAAIFDRPPRRLLPSTEKMCRESVLGPIAGTLINLRAMAEVQGGEQKSAEVARAVAQVDSSVESLACFRYLRDFNWEEVLKGDPSLAGLPHLRSFVGQFSEAVESNLVESQRGAEMGGASDESECCTICYCSPPDTTFLPCKHQSCRRCIRRRLLDDVRCFFCNTDIQELSSDGPQDAQLGGAGNQLVTPPASSAE